MSDSFQPHGLQHARLHYFWELLKFMSIEWLMLPNHLILCHLFFLLFPIFPTIRVLSNELTLLIRWPKYRSVSFSISPSSEYLRLISFRTSVKALVAQLCLTLCNPIDCSPPGSSVHGHSPGKNTGVSCHALLQGIFLTQGSNLGLLHCRQILYCLSHQRSPFY